jgi:hypothetical protein
MNAPAIFTINALVNNYHSTNDLSFSGFEYVNGGGEADQFNFDATNNQILAYRGGGGEDVFALIGNVTVPGQIDGQGGTDTLDYSGYTSGGVNVNLTNATASAIFGGLAGGINSIENVIGTAYDDILTGDIWNNVLNGGLGNDIYRFLDGWGNDLVTDLGGIDTLDFSSVSFALNFLIGAAGLTVSGDGNVLTVTGNVIESLLGGKSDDSFVFENGVSLAGGGAGTHIDGGGGVNLLDYQAYDSSHPVGVNLTTGAATGMNGGLPGGIANIRNVYGGSGDDALIGDALDNTFRGGPGNDTIDGMGGVNTLDESNATVALNVNLTTGVATGLGTDTLKNIQNVLTGSGNDTLEGNGQDNLLNGGSGSDTYIFLNSGARTRSWIRPRAASRTRWISRA